MAASAERHAGDLPLQVLVEQFEAATLPLGRFHHREHMRVALHYLAQASELEATARMRDGLKRLLAHHGIEGYHETVTVFWMKLLGARLAETDASRSFGERVDDVIAWCERAQPLPMYYTPEMLASAEAKTRWVPPDRRAIDF